MLAFPVHEESPSPVAGAPDLTAASAPVLTPFMRQYTSAKALNPDALLFFRMGDFYELFFDDAKTASRELQITLTARDRERSLPMCGVPYHAAEGYISRLLRKGYRVAICEQMEDPKLTKKIVRREVTRVLSPGTAIDPTLGSDRNNFLGALHSDGNTAAVALLDLSTGDFRAAEFTGPSAMVLAIDELTKVQPSELLLATTQPLLDPMAGEETRGLDRIATKTRMDDWIFSSEYAIPLLERQLGAHSLDGFGLTGHATAATAAGAVLHYVRSTQQFDAGHIDSIRFYERSEYLQLDQVTARNLELTEPLFSDSSQETTLFHAMDCCLTPMGKRLLRSSILRPLIDPIQIEARYEAVGELRHDLIRREAVRRTMGGILDLERLLARISLDSAGPRDVLALANSLARVPGVKAAVGELASEKWRDCVSRLDALVDIAEKITATLLEEPPLTLAEGGVIAVGVDAELDSLRSISQSGRQSIAAIEERERTRTGINSLKVRFNSVFGYYIEITKSNLANVPADYERKQTLVNAERFTTPELKDYEVRVLTAHERCIEIEKRLFAELRATVLGSIESHPALELDCGGSGPADKLCASRGAAQLCATED